MKLKVKETSYGVKPKQSEGKLVVGLDRFSVKPKQTEGKLRVLREAFTVKPKPDGVKVYRTKTRSVLKTDSRSGVKVYRGVYSSVLKRDARSGVRLYRANKTRVLKQTCDGTIFTWNARLDTVTTLGSFENSSVISGNAFPTLSSGVRRFTTTERPVILGITWNNTLSGSGSSSFPDGTYSDVPSFFADARDRTNPLAGGFFSDYRRTILTGDGTVGVTFQYDSNKTTEAHWLTLRIGFTGAVSPAAGTIQTRDFTIRNVSDGNTHLARFQLTLKKT